MLIGLRDEERTVKSLHTESYSELVTIVMNARLSSRLTQQEVADTLGKPQSFIAKVEGSERRIDVVEFIEIAKVMKHDPMELFSRFLERIDALKT